MNYQIKIAQQYGPITYCQLLGVNRIFINDVNIVKEIWPKKEFLTRAFETQKELKKLNYKHILTVGDENALPLIMLDGDSWTKRRKLAQTVNIIQYILYILQLFTKTVTITHTRLFVCTYYYKDFISYNDC